MVKRSEQEKLSITVGMIFREVLEKNCLYVYRVCIYLTQVEKQTNEELLRTSVNLIFSLFKPVSPHGTFKKDFRKILTKWFANQPDLFPKSLRKVIL